MSDDFSIDIQNLKGAQAKIQKLATDWGIDTKFLCQDQMRLWVIDVIKKAGGGPGTSLAQQKRVQKAAVESDIREVFADDKLEWLSGENNGVYYITSITGALWAAEKDGRAYSQSQMESEHNRRRTKSNKRVSKQRPYYKNGRLVVRKVYAKESQIKKYIRYKQGHIGKLKAGWIAPLNRLMAVTRGGDGKMALWVRGMASIAYRGTYTDNMTSFASGSIKSTNNTPYASDHITPAFIAATARTRQKDLMRQSKKRKEGIVKRFNETK